MEHIRQAFNDAASRYDAQRLAIIPEMEAFYTAAAWAAAWDGDKPDILDVGAGTGLLTALVLERYPQAAVTLIDLSEAMLKIAKQRFFRRERTRFITGDYTYVDPGGPFDIIVSALSIHHLPDEGKRQLYHRIFRLLRPGGIFVNADQVLGESAWHQRWFMDYWEDYVSKGPLSKAEREEIRGRRDTLDKNARLPVQLEWLREAGFSDVDVVYKNRIFVVFSGRKQ